MLAPAKREELRKMLFLRPTWTLEALAEDFWGVKQGEVEDQWWRHVRAEIGTEMKALGWVRIYLGKRLGVPYFEYMRPLLGSDEKSLRARINEALVLVAEEKLQTLLRLTVLAGRRDPKSGVAFAKLTQAVIEDGLATEVGDVVPGVDGDAGGWT